LAVGVPCCDIVVLLIDPTFISGLRQMHLEYRTLGVVEGQDIGRESV
ncbi:hypothetical protein TNIN_253271, partial [Trichonephila inaurata madagascariensis]